MHSCKIAIAQINTIVGDLPGNARKIIAAGHQAWEEDADLIAFPELTVSGYPPEDLVLKPHFNADCLKMVHQIAEALPPQLTALVGFPAVDGKYRYNSMAVLHGGHMLLRYDKCVLPNYGVFDEKRLFTESKEPAVLNIKGLRAGLHICEDSWFNEGAHLDKLKAAAPDVLINISASPYHAGKLTDRVNTLQQIAAALDCPLVYCNLVGGQDELVFDGASMVLPPEGAPLLQCSQFAEEMALYTLTSPADTETTPLPSGITTVTVPEQSIEKSDQSDQAQLLPLRTDSSNVMGRTEEIYSALKLGLRDYVNKNHFKRVVIASSGGIDSALVTVLASDAVGQDRVITVTMPSQYTSEGTLSDAQQLGSLLNIPVHTIPIKSLFDQYLDMLQPLWPGMEPDTTEENLQARIRGSIIMALSNKFRALVLATGNKSELATGYCTIYGDMVGGFSVIKDVPKTWIYELCRWRNTQGGGEVIPTGILERPPSAELRPDQKDTDSLPPYDVLDQILEMYVEKDMAYEGICEQGFPQDVVLRIIRLVDLNEYKRRQGAPGIKITPRAFGRDRRMPITNQYRATDERTAH